MSGPIIIRMRGIGSPLLVAARGLGKALLALLVIAFAIIMVRIISYLIMAGYVLYLLLSGPA
jgi:hypothetical protein